MIAKWLNKFFVLLVILYITQLINFLHSEFIIHAIFYTAIIIGGISMTLCIISPYKNVSPVAYIIIVFALLLPIISAWRSWVVFGQPIFYGIARMRYMFILLFAFHLYHTGYSFKTLMKQINTVNIIIAIGSIVLLYVFGVDNVVAEKSFFTIYSADTEATSDAIKGAKLTYCSQLIFVSVIYYMTACMQKLKIKDILILALFVFYTLFVHKGRQPLVAYGVIFLIYMATHLNKRNVIIGILSVGIISFIIINDNSIVGRYTTILEGDYSMDTSALARFAEVEDVVPYIKKYPIGGFGNLSYKFNEGFQGVFNDYFFIEDIGIIGVMAKGGIILIALCALFYYLCFRYTFRVENNLHKAYIINMLITCIVLSFIGSDTLTCAPALLVFIIYPMIYAPVKKKHVESMFSFRL